jgi:hypothetical protein
MCRNVQGQARLGGPPESFRTCRYWFENVVYSGNSTQRPSARQNKSNRRLETQQCHRASDGYSFRSRLGPVRQRLWMVRTVCRVLRFLKKHLISQASTPWAAVIFPQTRISSIKRVWLEDSWQGLGVEYLWGNWAEQSNANPFMNEVQVIFKISIKLSIRHDVCLDE